MVRCDFYDIFGLLYKKEKTIYNGNHKRFSFHPNYQETVIGYTSKKSLIELIAEKKCPIVTSSLFARIRSTWRQRKERERLYNDLPYRLTLLPPDLD